MKFTACRQHRGRRQEIRTRLDACRNFFDGALVPWNLTTMTLKGGVAIITGSGQGIGRAIALQLAEDGFDIALNDLPTNKVNLDHVAEEIAKKGRKVISVVRRR